MCDVYMQSPNPEVCFGMLYCKLCPTHLCLISSITLPLEPFLCVIMKKLINECLIKREFSINEGDGCGNLLVQFLIRKYFKLQKTQS